MTRDFTEEMKNQFLSLVKETHEDEWFASGVLDDVGDLFTIDVMFPWQNLDSYRAKMIDKNNTTAKDIEKIWTEVAELDSTYGARMGALKELAEAYEEKLKLIAEKIRPENLINTLTGDPQVLKDEMLAVTKKIEQEKVEYEFEKLVVRDKDGEIVDYDWERLEEYLNMDPKKVKEDDYRVLTLVIGAMGMEDIEKLANMAYIYDGLLDEAVGSANLSPVFLELTKRFENMALEGASVTLFNEDCTFEYDRDHMILQIDKASVLNCICDMGKAGYMKNGQYVTIKTEKAGNSQKYVVVLDESDFVNYDHPLGRGHAIKQRNKRKKTYEIYSWGDSQGMDGTLDNYVSSSMRQMKKSDGQIVAEDVCLFVLGKGAGTIDKSGVYVAVLSEVNSVQENRESNLKIDRNISAIQTGNYLEALHISASVVISEQESSIITKYQSIDEKELNMAIHVYNQEHKNVTKDQLLQGLESGKNSEELDQYTDWYKTNGKGGTSGKVKTEEYWKKLEEVRAGYLLEKGTGPTRAVKDLSQSQLEELMKKEADPAYEINDGVMQEER